MNTKFVVLICFVAYNISICQHMPIPMVHENVCIALTNDMDPSKKLGNPILLVKNYNIWRCYDFSRLYNNKNPFTNCIILVIILRLWFFAIYHVKEEIKSFMEVTFFFGQLSKYNTQFAI